MTKQDQTPSGALAQAGSGGDIDREAIRSAIRASEFGYSIQLIRLVDGESTYALRVDGRETEKFEGYDEASERLRELKDQASLDAIIALLPRVASDPLISAAPDLLEALTKVLDVVANEHSGSAFISSGLERLARAAILKATTPPAPAIHAERQGQEHVTTTKSLNEEEHGPAGGREAGDAPSSDGKRAP